MLFAKDLEKNHYKLQRVIFSKEKTPDLLFDKKIIMFPNYFWIVKIEPNTIC